MKSLLVNLKLTLRFGIIVTMFSSLLYIILGNLGANDFTASLISMQVSILLFALINIKFNKKFLIRELKHKLNYKTLLCSIILVLILFFTVTMSKAILLNEPFTSDMTNNVLNSSSLLVSVFIPVIFAPIAEELAFRMSLRKVMVEDNNISNMGFLVFSSLLFGLGHWQSGTYGIFLVMTVSLLGFINGLFYIKTNNILISIIEDI